MSKYNSLFYINPWLATVEENTYSFSQRENILKGKRIRATESGGERGIFRSLAPPLVYLATLSNKPQSSNKPPMPHTNTCLISHVSIGTFDFISPFCPFKLISTEHWLYTMYISHPWFLICINIIVFHLKDNGRNFHGPHRWQFSGVTEDTRASNAVTRSYYKLNSY
jgi:hypothetical protein